MNKYMQIADDEAKVNLVTNAGGPFGATIVKDGVVIACCSNHVLMNNDPTAHAEVETIRSACKKLHTHDLSGCELYTTCYPCPMCMSAIIWANIKKVYYGNTKEDAASIGFRDDFIYDFMNKLPDGDSNIIELVNIDREETINTFKDYYNKSDKEIY